MTLEDYKELYCGGICTEDCHPSICSAQAFFTWLMEVSASRQERITVLGMYKGKERENV